MNVLEAFMVPVGIITFLGAAFIFLRGSIYKGAITALESTVSAQGSQIDTLEKKVERGIQEGIRKDERIAALERDNASLTSVRPSAEAIQLLLERLESHHNETLEAIRDVKL